MSTKQDTEIDALPEEDSAAILSRRNALLSSVLLGTSLAARNTEAQQAPIAPEACLSAVITPPMAGSFWPYGRVSVPRERIPRDIRAQCASIAIYVSGGGTTVTPWRIILGPARVLRVASDPRIGINPSALSDTWSITLDPEPTHRLFTLADQVWRTGNSTGTEGPLSAYEERIVFLDGNQGCAFFAAGGFRSGLEQQLIRELRALPRITLSPSR